MTVGNFSEVIGTDGFDSLRGEDLSVVYGVEDGDNLNSSFSSPGANPTTILVGGSGDNNYIVWNDSTTLILENSNSENILWTTIGNSTGISLDDDNSFAAEIDNRHLYLGNRESNQYTILIDWQLPENQIETFSLAEGDLSYDEFVDRFRSSSNYRGNFTWAEIANSEIDLARLGLSADSIDTDLATIRTRSEELESSEEQPEENPDATPGVGDYLLGTFGDDLIEGGVDNDTLIGIGTDTLVGGLGDDLYSVGFSQEEAGIEIRDSGGDEDDLQIIADNSDLNAVVVTRDLESERSNPNIYGDSAIELSLPEAGIVGLQKSDADLIIDLNRDGVAESENDLTVFNFFDENGELGTGGVEKINNIVDSQDIVDFFASNSEPESTTNSLSTVYRFFNNDAGVHFYTANETERDAVEELPNYSFEGESYRAVDPLTGTDESTAVYRFFNEDTGVHLYTISEIERDATEELSNFSFEGEAFAAYATEVDGSIPIYRFFNPTTGAHFYTPSVAERDNVANNLSEFEAEGIAYWALPVAE